MSDQDHADPTAEAAAYATDLKMDLMIARLLRGGVLLAAGVALVGGVIYVLRYGALPSDHHVFAGEPDDLRGVLGIVRGAATLRSRWLIQLGLLLLIATPIMRVAVSLVAFARQKDRMYVAVTAIVLALLCFSLFVGRG